MNNNNNSNTDNDNDSNNSNTNANRINLVVLGNNAGFRQLCQDLRANSRNDLKDVSVWLRPCSQHYLDEFAASVKENRTVQRLVVAAMSDATTSRTDFKKELRRLGDVVADNENITKVTVVLTSCHGLEAFWEGLGRSTSLKVLTISRLLTRGTLAPLLQRLSRLEHFRYLFLKDCTLEHSDAQALSAMLGSCDANASAFSMTNCTMEENDKVDLAHSIAKSTSLRFLRMDDALNGPAGPAFGKVLIDNKHLIEVQFLKCSDTAVESLASAIKGNVTLIKAKVSALNQNRQTQALTQQVSHIAKLNRRGRRFLQENAVRPQGASLEKTWKCMLLRDRSNHQIVYSLIHDYPSIFVSTMNLDVLEQIDKQAVYTSSEEEPPRKKRRIETRNTARNAERQTDEI